MPFRQSSPSRSASLDTIRPEPTALAVEALLPSQEEPNFDAREAALHATWLAAYRRVQPSQSPTPYSHEAYLQHNAMSERIRRQWAPSRSAIREGQRTITRAEKELQALATFRAMSSNCEASVNGLVEHIIRGIL